VVLPAAGEASFSAFGVFDGHGGSQAATFASNHLLQAVMAEVDASPLPPPQLPAVEGLSEEEAAVWRLQATLMARLPQVR
jgi:serine/threonine protein phosphatase PrpC